MESIELSTQSEEPTLRPNFFVNEKEMTVNRLIRRLFYSVARRLLLVVVGMSPMVRVRASFAWLGRWSRGGRRWWLCIVGRCSALRHHHHRRGLIVTDRDDLIVGDGVIGNLGR